MAHDGLGSLFELTNVGPHSHGQLILIFLIKALFDSTYKRNR